MSAALARAGVQAALFVVVLLLVWPPLTPWSLVSAVPVLGLALLGFRPTRRWGGWVTVLMIPYFGVATMNIMAGPMDFVPALAFGVASVAAGLGGLDWLRRTGTSLRT